MVVWNPLKSLLQGQEVEGRFVGISEGNFENHRTPGQFAGQRDDFFMPFVEGGERTGKDSQLIPLPSGESPSGYGEGSLA
jgi:hypothetical protein